MLGASLTSVAQQTEQLSMYMFNRFGHNPAFAGMNRCFDIRLGHRMQWFGFEHAPSTTFANFNMQILKNKSRHNEKHGVGLKILSDDAGLLGKMHVNLSYAYHFKLNRKLKMSAGVDAGFLQYKFNRSLVNAYHTDDPVLDHGRSKLLLPDINFGVLLYNERFFSGFVLKQVWRNKIKDVFPDSRLTHHIYVNAGKSFMLSNEKISVVPSVLMKFTRLSVPSLDFNLMFRFKDNLSAGLSYRNTDAVVAMFKVNFLKQFSLGYSIDIVTSKIRQYGSLGHEFVLGMRGCPISDRHNYECPIF
jgi:type IX secretion system PorP/SprF family membrane protein